MAVNLKTKRFSKYARGFTELPTNSPTCSADQKPFFQASESQVELFGIYSVAGVEPL